MKSLVAFWDERESPEALALVRIGLALVLLFDRLQVAALGLVLPLWGPEGAGGFADPVSRGVPLYQLLPATGASTWGVWGIEIALLLCILLGVRAGWAALAFVLVDAQLAWVQPASDRGIERLMRDALLILAFSPSDALWSVRAWWHGAQQSVVAWPRRLLALQIVLLYAGAGVSKVSTAWTPAEGFSALWMALHDPAFTRFPGGLPGALYPATQALTVSTLVWEWSALLIPVVWWVRRRRGGGRVGAWLRSAPVLRVWLLVGALFHIGTHLTLNLGIFPFGAMALYPAWVAGGRLRAAKAG